MQQYEQKETPKPTMFTVQCAVITGWVTVSDPACEKIKWWAP